MPHLTFLEFYYNITTGNKGNKISTSKKKKIYLPKWELL
jgi:hypothetical protein